MMYNNDGCHYASDGYVDSDDDDRSQRAVINTDSDGNDGDDYSHHI